MMSTKEQRFYEDIHKLQLAATRSAKAQEKMAEKLVEIADIYSEILENIKIKNEESNNGLSS